MLKKESSFWITGLKFISCVCIYFVHFNALFYHGASFVYSYSSLYSLLHSACNMFFNAYFYLTIFYLLSGLLAQNKEIKTFKELIKTLILRYFRFSVPLFFAALFSYVISLFPGYYCEEAAQLTGNSFFNIFTSENVTLKNVLKCTFLFDSSINPILWTIRCIFWGTCIIYILNYLTKTLSVNIKLIVNTSVALLLIIISGFENVNLHAIACTVLGSVFLLLWDIIDKRFLPNKTATVIVVFIFVILNSLYGKMSSLISNYIHIADGDIYYMNLLYDTVIAFLFIFFMNYSETVKNLFSVNLLKKTSDTSFALYMVHEPVLCSVGLFIFVKCFDPVKYYILIPAIFVITTIVLIIVVNIYHKTIDRTSNMAIAKIKKSVNSLII